MSARRAMLRAGRAAALLALAPSAVLAQVDSGQLLRESQQQSQPRLEPPALPAPVAEPPATPQGPTVRVRGFQIEGASRYDDATLQAQLAPLRNQDLDFAGLQRAADTLAEYYRQQGWHVAALLPEQDLQNGLLRIVVIESRFGRLRAPEAGTLPAHVPLARIEGYLARAARAGEPLNLDALAHATGVANELPGAQLGTVLAAGQAPGETDLVLQVTPRPPLTGTVSVDNQDARATGEHKVSAALSLASPAGLGELYQLSASRSEGKTFVRAATSWPVGNAGWRLGASTSLMSYRLVGDAAITQGTGQPNGARGDAATWGLTAAYNLARTPAWGATLQLAADHRASRNETVVGTTSDKRADNLSATLQLDATDGLGGGGANGASFTVTSGRVDLSRVPTDLATDAATAQVQGGFRKLSTTLTRLQRLWGDHTLWLVFNGQLANGNLDGAEKFSLGGPSGVRAYPLLEGSGDEGATLSAAWRWQHSASLRLEAFYDTGWVRRWKTPFAGSGTPNTYSLRGTGLAAEWTPDRRWRLSGTLARRIGTNPGALSSGADNDGSHQTWRAWLGASLLF